MNEKFISNLCNRSGLVLPFLFSVIFVGFVGNSPAQTFEQIKFYTERIEFGTDEVKRNALHDLRNFQTETASQIALPSLKDSSEVVRATATHSVVYLPKELSAQALLPLLKEKSEFVRRETAYALGKTKNPDVANELIQLLEKDKKQSVKDAATVSLGKIGNPIAIQALLKILSKKPKEKDKFTRRAAARSIGQIAETLQQKKLTFETPTSFLPLEYKTISKTNYIDLVETNPVFHSVVKVLIVTLQNNKEYDDVKRESAFALGSIGNSSAIPILQANLNNTDYYLAEICKESLFKIENSTK